MTTQAIGALLAESECLLLDFDGPVCSVFSGWPAGDVAESMRSTLLTEGHPITEVGRTTSDPMMVLLEAATASAAGGRRAEELLQSAEMKCMTTAKPTPGLTDLLQAAHALHLPIVIVSNNSEPAIRAYLTSHSLADLVGDVFGRESTDPSLMKPDPYLLRRALAATGTPPDGAVLVGDSVTDIQASRAAHVRVIAFANRPSKVKSLEQGQPDLLITALAELTDILRARAM